jgi:Asp-tRNA(Asn)/Glu-tRNA(Gln) amidotransferase A subunit family amidase
MERVYEAFLSRYDVILTPTLAAPPVKIGEQAPGWSMQSSTMTC